MWRLLSLIMCCIVQMWCIHKGGREKGEWCSQKEDRGKENRGKWKSMG